MRHGVGELLTRMVGSMMKSGMREYLTTMTRDYKEVWGMVGSMVKLRMRELLMTMD